MTSVGFLWALGGDLVPEVAPELTELAELPAPGIRLHLPDRRRQERFAEWADVDPPREQGEPVVGMAVQWSNGRATLPVDLPGDSDHCLGFQPVRVGGDLAAMRKVCVLRPVFQEHGSAV